MTESVEEIVARMEERAALYPDHEIFPIVAGNLRALIGSWRERGEALKEARPSALAFARSLKRQRCTETQ